MQVLYGAVLISWTDPCIFSGREVVSELQHALFRVFGGGGGGLSLRA